MAILEFCELLISLLFRPASNSGKLHRVSVVPQPSPREMVRSLSRDTTAGSIPFVVSFLAQVPHGPRTSVQSVPTAALFLAQRCYSQACTDIGGVLVQPRRACHDRLLHFQEKVHRKDLAQGQAIPLLMPRLLSHVLSILGSRGATYRALAAVLKSYPWSGPCLCRSLFFYTNRRR